MGLCPYETTNETQQRLRAEKAEQELRSMKTTLADKEEHLARLLSVSEVDRLERELLAKAPDTRLNGHPEQRLPNTSNISFEYVEGESILLLLDRRPFYYPFLSVKRGVLYFYFIYRN